MGGSIVVNGVGCIKLCETAQRKQSCACMFLCVHTVCMSNQFVFHAVGLFLYAADYSVLCIYVGLRLYLLCLLHVWL